MRHVTSRNFAPSGGDETSSVTTPTKDFLRNGTSTRQPGRKAPCIACGTTYVKVLRNGTGSATLQNGKVIAVVSVAAELKLTGRGARFQQKSRRSQTTATG